MSQLRIIALADLGLTVLSVVSVHYVMLSKNQTMSLYLYTYLFIYTDFIQISKCYQEVT